MKLFSFKFEIGEQVKCFDSSKYIDDIKTPPIITMRNATVMARRFIVHYGKWAAFYDVRFDDRLSTNHFESSLRKI